MVNIDVERKRPSLWPWIIGLFALALAIWGVAELVEDEGGERQESAVVQPWQPEVEPAAVPAPPNAEPAAERPLTEVLPLDLDDIGQRVRVDGEVVAAAADGFWIRAGDDVLFVVSDRAAREGERLVVAGTVRESPADAPALASAQEGWSVHRGVQLEERTAEIPRQDRAS